MLCYVAFSLAAEMELLSTADMLVGNMGSQVTRTIYDKMVASTATSVVPPFISVDGYVTEPLQQQRCVASVHRARLSLQVRPVLRLHRGVLEGGHREAQPADPRVHLQVWHRHGRRPVLLLPRLTRGGRGLLQPRAIAPC